MTYARDIRSGTILIVCTGNVCRSPYVERLLTTSLAATEITVSSAGTGALVGSEMDPRVSLRLAELGCDPVGFVARQLSPDVAKAADLVLCATREHRSLVVRTAPRVLFNTYALADFSDLAARLASTGFADLRSAAGPSRNFVQRLSEAAARVRGEVRVRTTREAEIVDPYRRSDKVLEQMVQQVDSLLQPIVSVLTAPIGP